MEQFICPEFPIINIPMFLSREDNETEENDYKRWVSDELLGESQNVFAQQLFKKLTKSLQMVRSVSLQDRFMDIMNGKLPNYNDVLTILSAVQTYTNQNFPPLWEIIGDMNYLFATSADFFLRKLETEKGSEESKKIMRSQCKYIFGAENLFEVKKQLETALAFYAKWMMAVNEIVRTAENSDPQLNLIAQLEINASNYVTTLSRIMTLLIADWLYEYTDIHLNSSFVFEVLPHLILYPEARSLFHEKNGEIEFAIMFMKQVLGKSFRFRDEQIATATLNNFGVFATVMGSYNWAREIFSTALTVSPEKHKQLIKLNLALVAQISPQDTNC